MHEAALLAATRAGTNGEMLDDVYGPEQHRAVMAFAPLSGVAERGRRSAARVAGSR